MFMLVLMPDNKKYGWDSWSFNEVGCSTNFLGRF